MGMSLRAAAKQLGRKGGKAKHRSRGPRRAGLAKMMSYKKAKRGRRKK